MEIIFPIFDTTGNAITGAGSATDIKIRRGNDGELLDWSDLSFKASGWTSLVSTFTEIDATNVPGYYTKTASESGWNDGRYQLISTFSGTVIRNGVSEVLVTSGQLVDALTTSQVTSVQATVNSIDIEVGSNSTALSSLQASVNSLSTTITEIVDLTSIDDGMPRIEAGDTFQFTKNWNTAPNSSQVNIFHRSTETIVVSGVAATQSGTSANFYYFHTTNVSSGFTTVNSSGVYVIEWVAFRDTGNDRFNEYFEVIRTDG